MGERADAHDVHAETSELWHAIERYAPGNLDHGATLGASDRLANVFWSKVVEHDAVDTGAEGLVELGERGDFDFDAKRVRRACPNELDGRADAVFGSRYRGSEGTRILPFWHSRMNGFLTLVSNMFSNLDLTDMETCYKGTSA